MSKDSPAVDDVFVGPGAELWYIKEILATDPWNGKPRTTYRFSDPYNLHPDRYLDKDGLQSLMKIGIIQFAWTKEEAKSWKA